eukprot:g14643.t1
MRSEAGSADDVGVWEPGVSNTSNQHTNRDCTDTPPQLSCTTPRADFEEGGDPLSLSRMDSSEPFEYAPETRANALSFQEVCEDLLEKMADQTRLTGAKLDLLKPFLARLGRESPFPLLRLILPELDNLRDKYGMRTAKVASLFAELNFPKKQGDWYSRLFSYTDPAKNPSPGDPRWQVTGDFALTLEYVLTETKRGVSETKWTIEDVNTALTDLAMAPDDKRRRQVLNRIRSECSPMNQKWIVRMILKNLKISMKKSVLNKIHPDALEEYNRTTSLRKVCTRFIGVHSSIRSTAKIEVFTSFSPMLATNFFYKTDKVLPSMHQRPFCMDIKLDGERMLCHREGTKVMWFTRKAKDYTEKYGAVLTPQILAGVSAHKCVLDGEVVTWDDNTGSMVPFGSNRTYAKEELEGRGDGTRRLFYVVFDILLVEGDPQEDTNGGAVERSASMDEVVRDAVRNSIAPCPPASEVKAGNLTALPLDVRRRVLRSVVTEREHRLEIVKSWDVGEGDEEERKKLLFECFEERAIHLNEEGLVVKDLHGHYVLGDKSRKAALWVKMKPEYSEQTEDMDVIILAAGFANGNMRSGLLSKFLVGVAAPSEEGKPREKFYPIARLGTGYSLNELEDLNELLQGKWKTFDEEPPHFFPDKVAVKKSSRDGVPLTRWIHPEDSICLQVKCMEIVRAHDWPGIFCTMRFPRVTHIRKDKGMEGCIDTTELAAIQARPRLTFGNDQNTTQGGHGGAGSRRKGGGEGGRGKGRGGGRAGRQVSELFAMAGGTVAVKEQVFVAASDSKKPLEMCVIGDSFYSEAHKVAGEGINVDAWWSSSTQLGKRKEVARGGEALGRNDMELLIRQHGGTVTANPMSKTTSFVVVGEKNTVRVKRIIATAQYNVVDYRWILECIERKTYVFPAMQHLRAMSAEAREYFQTIKDEFGDDYREHTDAASLSKLMLNITKTSGGRREAVESAWLSPLQELDEMDVAGLKDGTDLLFAERCLVYCDLFTNLGPAEPPGTANGDGDGALPAREEIQFNSLGSMAQAVRLYGGEVARSLHVGVTHVVMDPDDLTRLGAIKGRIRDLHQRKEQIFHIRVVKPDTTTHLSFLHLQVELAYGRSQQQQRGRTGVATYREELDREAPSTMAQTDRDALSALHNATDGPKWKNNTNWNTDADLSEWYGVKLNGEGRVAELSLGNNNLRGRIPEELGKLSALHKLVLYGNQLPGAIPPELGDLGELRKLWLSNNQLTGPIPAELGNLHALKQLLLFDNQLSALATALDKRRAARHGFKGSPNAATFRILKAACKAVKATIATSIYDHLERYVTELKAVNQRRDMRGLYQHLKRSTGLGGRQAGGQQFVTDENGVLLPNKDAIRKQWRRFFDTLLNSKSPTLNADVVEQVAQRPTTRATRRLAAVPDPRGG